MGDVFVPIRLNYLRNGCYLFTNLQGSMDWSLKGNVDTSEKEKPTRPMDMNLSLLWRLL